NNDGTKVQEDSMYCYIDIEKAAKDGKIEHENLSGYFKFKVSSNRKLSGNSNNGGRAHLSCAVVPEEVKPYLIDFYTERVEWDRQAHRYTGIYRHGEAIGTLEHRTRVETVGEYSNEGGE